MTKIPPLISFFFEIKRLFLSILVKNCTQSSQSTRGVLASRASMGVLPPGKRHARNALVGDVVYIGPGVKDRSTVSLS